MKMNGRIFSFLAVAALCVPATGLFSEPEPAAASVPAETQAGARAETRVVEFDVPVLSVSGNGENAVGRLSRLPLEFRRTASDAPFRVSISDDVSGGSGEELRSSLWSAATVAALMRRDLMNGVRLTLDFSGNVDGPSAGGVFCLAILSALDGREFPRDFAMTGTILPDGSVGLVGGVARKIEAAAKAGIRRVCVPALGRVEDDGEGNLQDLVVLAERLGVEVILVETVEEAYAAAHRLPTPERKMFAEREALSVSREQEDAWYDAVFENFNRGLAITRRHETEIELDDPYLSRYRENLQRSVRLLKAGYFQRAAENAFDGLLFMRAWDASLAVKEDFWRTYPDGLKILSELVENPEKAATDADRKILTAYRSRIWNEIRTAPRAPSPREGDDDVPAAPDGTGYYRDAPWETEISAQLEPVLAEDDDDAWFYAFESEIKKDVSDVKTKEEILRQMNLEAYQEILARVGKIRRNEGAYFLRTAETTPQIRGNANLMKAGNFYHAVRAAVEASLRNGFRDSFSGDDRHLLRFLGGCRTSDEQFSDVRDGKKEADPSYNALARIITDCRLLALGAALQIKYGPDVGAVATEDLWVNSYANTYFLNALIRTARVQALSSIKKCRDANVPCPAALSAFVEADTSRGDFARDQLFDVLANYWTAGNIAQALALCFDPQPALEESAARGNADAQFLLGHRAGLQGDIGKARELLEKSARQGDARALYRRFMLTENAKKDFPLLVKSAELSYLPAVEYLARAYWRGAPDAGVPQDRPRAFSLFRKAAYLGSAAAQDRVAWCCINEEKLVPDREAGAKEGFEWQRLAAERDALAAQYRMAGDCKTGAPWCEKDEFSMFRWFSRAAEQGHAHAAAQLGDCYYFGAGTEKNPETAAKWFRKSATSGDAYGQYSYAVCLLKGEGVGEDSEEGMKWLSRAAENGSEEAKAALEKMKDDAEE